MNTYKKLAAVTAALLASFTSLRATVLDFDDINTGGTFVSIGVYNGFTFSNSNFVALDAPNNGLSAVSGRNVTTNTFQEQTLTTSGAAFDFNGAYFSNWPGFGIGTLTLKGYNGATLIGTETINLTNSLTWYASSLDGITSLQFVTPGSGWWLMDNFTYNESTSVPDNGATVALVGLTLCGLATLRRKFAR